MLWLFWCLLVVVLYTYIGYGLTMYILVKIKFLFKYPSIVDKTYEPEVTLVVPCYNERNILDTKVINCLALDYPESKLKIYFIVDGSTDDSAAFLNTQSRIECFYQPIRQGKAAAENRIMAFVQTPIVIFTDANTMLNKTSIREIVKHFSDPIVGVVSGEKRIYAEEQHSTSMAGEGVYWKFESKLKKLDSDFYSAIGAAGELIAFRTDLVTHLEPDTILDDFMQSMRITLKGYKNKYEPLAFAEETASANVKEELKRKVRISAGSWQSMLRLPLAFNPFHNFPIFFMFIFHKVFRWVFVPLAILLLIPLTTYLGFTDGGLYLYFAILQFVFYIFVVVGKIFEDRRVRVKLFFVPYYFIMTNWCLCLGFFRFLTGNQKATWERSKRYGEVESEIL